MGVEEANMLNIIPGFRFTFCFGSEEDAIAKAQRTKDPVIFWKDKQRHVALPCDNGTAILRMHEKDETYRAFATIRQFFPDSSYGDVEHLKCTKK